MSHTITTIAENLLLYLEEQKLSSQLPNLIAALQQELDRKQEITVISAEVLSHSDQQTVTRQAEATWGTHQISFQVDPLLVTGLLIRFNDQVLDLSAQSRLTDLKAHLA